MELSQRIQKQIDELHRLKSMCMQPEFDKRICTDFLKSRKLESSVGPDFKTRLDKAKQTLEVIGEELKRTNYKYAVTNELI